MKPGIAFTHEKLAPILDMDEFWTPAWEIDAIEARLLSDDDTGPGVRRGQSLQAFDD